MTAIRNIAPADVKAGKNWKVVSFEGDVVDWVLEECNDFSEEDYVAYSFLTLYEDGRVEPGILVREFKVDGWWGDMATWVDGCWRQPGLDLPLTDNPGIVDSYVANPLPDDWTFLEEYGPGHAVMREGFAKWKHLLPDR